MFVTCWHNLDHILQKTHSFTLGLYTNFGSQMFINEGRCILIMSCSPDKLHTVLTLRLSVRPPASNTNHVCLLFFFDLYGPDDSVFYVNF